MEAEKEEMWRKQQEILAERRSGSGKSLKEAEKRRQRVRDEVFSTFCSHHSSAVSFRSKRRRMRSRSSVRHWHVERNQSRKPK